MILDIHKFMDLLKPLPIYMTTLHVFGAILLVLYFSKLNYYSKDILYTTSPTAVLYAYMQVF